MVRSKEFSKGENKKLRMGFLVRYNEQVIETKQLNEKFDAIQEKITKRCVLYKKECSI